MGPNNQQGGQSTVSLDHPYSLLPIVFAQLGKKVVTKNYLQKQDALIKNILI